MKRDEVSYKEALLDSSKHLVKITEIDRPFSRLHKFYCPHCQKEMYATFGEVQLSHFRHNGEKCQYYKYLHSLAEHVFFEEYSRCCNNGKPFFLELRIPISCNNACVLKKHADCREHYIRKAVDLTKEYKYISLEERVDLDGHSRRPDILLKSLDGKQLWVEIWVSHETEDEKRKDGRIIEIKIDTEEDIEKIRQHKIVQSEGGDFSVRIFGIDNNGSDEFLDQEDLSIIEYPCEQYYCFEVSLNETCSKIIDGIDKSIHSDILYKAILRLNWKNNHNNPNGISRYQIPENTLLDFCWNRFYHPNRERSHNKSLESLIVFEWKDESGQCPNFIKKPMVKRTNYMPYDKKTSYISPQPICNPFDLSKIDWVDLGLPSGTLWAKEDIEKNTTFNNANRFYGVHVPSKTNAEELKESCTKKWDGESNALVLTGPNGNSISFPCKEGRKSYWLNAYEKRDPKFGKCFHVNSDMPIFINDKDVNSLLYVRLVKHR